MLQVFSLGGDEWGPSSPRTMWCQPVLMSDAIVSNERPSEPARCGTIGSIPERASAGRAATAGPSCGNRSSSLPAPATPTTTNASSLTCATSHPSTLAARQPWPSSAAGPWDGALGGKHHNSLAQVGLLAINKQHGGALPERLPAFRGTTCHHDLWSVDGRVAERTFTDDGTAEYRPIPIPIPIAIARLEMRKGTEAHRLRRRAPDSGGVGLRAGPERHLTQCPPQAAGSGSRPEGVALRTLKPAFGSRAGGAAGDSPGKRSSRTPMPTCKLAAVCTRARIGCHLARGWAPAVPLTIKIKFARAHAQRVCIKVFSTSRPRSSGDRAPAS